MKKEQASKRLEQLYLKGLLNGWFNDIDDDEISVDPYIDVYEEYVRELSDLEEVIYGDSLDMAGMRKSKEFNEAYRIFLTAPLIKALK